MAGCRLNVLVVVVLFVIVAFVCLPEAARGARSGDKAERAVKAKKTADDNLEWLARKADSNAVIKVNEGEIRRIVQHAPRPYDILIVLTSGSSCAMCEEIRPEYNLLGSLYNKARYKTFAEPGEEDEELDEDDLDDADASAGASGSGSGSGGDDDAVYTYDDGKPASHNFFVLEMDASRNYKFFRDTLGYKTIPHVIFVPATKGLGRKRITKLFSNKFNMQRGSKAEDIDRFLKGQKNLKLPEIAIERPPEQVDYKYIFTLVIGVGSLLGFSATIGRNFVQQQVLGNRKLWLFLALCAYAFCFAGGMFNSIRNTPFVGRDREGKEEYIYKSSGSQYGAEGYIVSGLNLVGAGAIVFFHEGVHKLAANQWTRTLLAGLSALVLLFCMSQLRTIYTMKNGGYANGFLWGRM